MATEPIWGCVHEKRFITPETRDEFAAKRLCGACMKCVKSKTDGILELHFKESIFRAYAEGFRERPIPEFEWGETVVLRKNGKLGKIREICWHRKEKRYYYLLFDVSGKKMKTRRFADELEKSFQ